MNKGRLIVFEGASDGIGKSTQIKLLQENDICSIYIEDYFE